MSVIHLFPKADFSVGISASGSDDVDFSGSTGAFKTSTGTVTLGGTNAAVNTNYPITYTGTSTTTNPHTWTAVAYLNNYVDFSETRGTFYYKDAIGCVHISISAKAGTNGAPIFTLPVGFRPRATWIRRVPATVDGAFGQLDVNPNGDVSCAAGGNSSVFTEIIIDAEA